MGQSLTDLAFGYFRLKRQERLLAGPDGPVELSARAFDLLVVLLDHPGEVISKDALFAAVWPGVVVEENTLQVHISALRKALPPLASLRRIGHECHLAKTLENGRPVKERAC